ncbi:putative baseplate assembly protein [Nannocystaceae bacterium ST9]
MDFRCANPGRRQALLEQTGAPASWINALDYVVVHDHVGMPNGLRQRVLAMRFLFPGGLAGLSADNFVLRGGVRVVDPALRWAMRASDVILPGGPALTPSADPKLSSNDRAWLTSLVAGLDQPTTWVIALVEERGDFSRYRLRLQTGPGSEQPPVGFDRRLCEVELSVKVDCPNDFDCAAPPSHAPAQAEPELDYLARDFSSFRRLMFDRLALLLPDEPKREPALLQTALVELLAYAADELAYFQDAVATEAHLASARLRSSVRRHARLLDYRMHEGCNARGFVHIALAPGQVFAAAADEAPLLPEGTRFLSAVPDVPALVRPESIDEVLSQGPEVFELMLPVRSLRASHGEIAVHTWGDDDCCLSRGATRLTLVADDPLALAPGDFLLLEEVYDPDTGVAADASPARRHVVRLTEVGPTYTDELLAVDVVDVGWSSEDALPFALPIRRGGQASAVARGNLALVDHGRSFVSDRPLAQRPFGVDGRTRVELPERELGFRVPLTNAARASSSAAALLRQDPRAALPVIGLSGEGESWTPAHDLLSSDRSAREFVVELENDGRVWLRFGDDVDGRRPAPSTEFVAHYRIGRGARGNVGAEAIAHLIATPGLDSSLAAAIRAIRNPLAASGGCEPEPLAEVKLYAPRAFVRQERAVTLEDWAEVASRHAEVQRAVATMRWTGSWNTIALAIDRVGGRPVDAAFEAELRGFLERFRLAGYDLEIAGPRWVPLDIALSICIDARHLRSVVAAELLAAFGTGPQRDGTPGFFHPDNFSFGQPVYLSHVIARAARVPGVRWADATPRVLASDNDNRFQRWGRQPAGEIASGVLPIGRLEIARCDNDRNLPDNGRIRFFMDGGA